MAGRSSQILETILSIVDKASTQIDDVAKKAERLEQADPTVKLDADDNASDDLEDVTSLADRFDGRTAKAKLLVEERAAKADLRKFERDLAKVDSAEAEAEIIVDITEAERRLDTIQNELNSIDGETPGIDVGSGFGSGFKAALGTAGIGGFLVTTFNAGVEKMQLRARFAEQFGLVKDDADRLGGEAAAIYEDGWGESLDEVYGALGRVQQELVATKVVAVDQADDITTSALVIADVFGKDVSEVIGAVGKILKNGLAPDAESAMDAVYEALQHGADGAGDLLETINEYSQQFDRFGLNIEDMMSILSTGMQNGKRDTDKVADAVQQMAILTTDSASSISDAYEDLGLDADEYRRRVLAGGDDARQAYREILEAIMSVEDPAEQNRLAIELIGTQYEDLGANALEILASIGDGHVEVTGAVKEGTEAIGEQASETELLWRRSKTAFADAGEAFATVLNGILGGSEESANELDAIMESSYGMAGALSEARDESMSLGGALSDARGETSVYNSEAQNLIATSIEEGLAQRDTADATDELTGAVEGAAAAHVVLDNKVAEATEAINESIEATRTAREERRRLADGTYDARDAEDAFHDSTEALVEIQEDAKSTEREKAAAVRDSVKATSEMISKQLEEQGVVMDSERGQREWTNSMRDSALYMGGPLGSEILAYVGRVNGIPEEKVTEAQAALDRGSVDEAKRIIDTELDKAVANPSVQPVGLETARNRIEAILGRTVNLAVSTYVPGGSGGRRSHTGSRFEAGETKQIIPGQVFTPDTPGRMSSPGESKRMIEAAMGGDTYNVTVKNNGRDLTGDDIARALRKLRLSS